MSLLKVKFGNRTYLAKYDPGNYIRDNFVVLINGLTDTGYTSLDGSLGALQRDMNGPIVATDNLGTPYFNRRNFVPPAGKDYISLINEKIKTLFTSNVYTIDFWIRFSGGSNNANQNKMIFFVNSNTSARTVEFAESYYNTPYLWLYGGTVGRISFGNGWTHVAIVCDGTDAKLYLNGVYTTHKIPNQSYTGTDMVRIYNYAQYQLNSNLQMSLAQFAIRDYVVWTENFTPPALLYKQK